MAGLAEEGNVYLELLRRWHKAAARAESIEEFEQAVGLVQL